MSDSTNGREVIGLWVGVVGASLAVLAFFGITNFDELGRRLDPGIADEEACEMFAEAINDLSVSAGTYGDGIDTAADVFEEAADHANDDGLTQALNRAADAYHLEADARRLAETEGNSESTNRASSDANDAYNAVLVFCNA
ncbi:hypothetical protein [Streptomyces sp. NBC_01803]|uniref:hypothetical protein n=1 Tax=Streptomyces sp. NBC_01803 TaxID=2975946 RepID=UPI002DDA5C0A|nr:hypothetical protein [Streptomyces sp. NBC_01803]WSA42747.1 hypothetical protein OIE51_00095 [Streptomyces sp. NBC_01803]